MFRGKSILLALVLAIVNQAGLSAGESHDPIMIGDGVVSLRKNAVVTIGGEVATDYSYRSARTTSTRADAPDPTQAHIGDLSVRYANLRIQADVHPHVSAFFKVDLSANGDRYAGRDEILEEALVVMSAVGGTGLGFFAGKGRVPYGQDVTLGMLQSYHHSANQWDSSEGLIFLSDPPDERQATGRETYPPAAPMRPGQVDRVFLAGASYVWQDRWKVEAAAFQPSDFEFRERLTDTERHKGPGRIGAAARVWWRPFEDLTLQFSAMAMRSHAMARTQNRTDILQDAGVRGAGTAYAFSAGFDWVRGPWRFFGEYQKGVDWNFTKGYDTDTWQLGLGREFGDGWRAGVMAEGLHIDNAAPREAIRQDFYKLALNIRYTFTSGMFVIAEYGHEWQRRKQGGGLTERRQGDFIGFRFGFAF